ncbi:pre-toxin TG domain-containing protein [Sutcliffiella cohnii]|uniref:pre-toxin TG domain-containing protein n=1 Tax=Sutcliffiella cohnii TaxID=33932 RepID=UPI002E23312C|nr:pre-toxin TG domain-containing protein [Sutcliffiella cohnii]
MDQYAGMTSSYEGYIGENNIFGQPLGGNAPKNVETVATILDFLPFIYDPLTGRKLEDWERAVAAAAILGGGAARIGGKVAPKVVDKVWDVGKGTDN